ncbi:unnamed protein product, partial [Iphiclides podalirius]
MLRAVSEGAGARPHRTPRLASPHLAFQRSLRTLGADGTQSELTEYNSSELALVAGAGKAACGARQGWKIKGLGRHRVRPLEGARRRRRGAQRRAAPTPRAPRP